MSLFYLFFIERVLGGRFLVGRWIDLLQLDIIAFGVILTAFYNAKRWQRLKNK